MSTVVSSLAVFSLCVGLLAPPFQARPLAPAREDVVATIKEAVRLLDAREYKTVLFEFFPPDFVKMKQSTSAAATEEWLAMFSTMSVGFILPKLRASVSVTPTLDDMKTKATFRFKTHEGTGSLLMVKVDRYWYIEPYQ